MKKIIYVFVLMVAMTLMNVSCTKSENETLDSTNPSTGLITLNDLNGTWNTTSYVLNDKTYTNSAQILADPAVNNKLSMLLTFVVTGNTCNVIDKSTGTNKETDGFNLFLNTKVGEIIIGDDDEYVFTVQSYDKNLKTLVLIIKSEYILNGEVPIGGKYNLQK